MVFTAAQTTTFCTSPDQMGVPADTYDQLQVEQGITSVNDLLAEFEAARLVQTDY